MQFSLSDNLKRWFEKPIGSLFNDKTIIIGSSSLVCFYVVGQTNREWTESWERRTALACEVRSALKTDATSVKSCWEGRQEEQRCLWRSDGGSGQICVSVHLPLSKDHVVCGMFGILCKTQNFDYHTILFFRSFTAIWPGSGLYSSKSKCCICSVRT